MRNIEFRRQGAGTFQVSCLRDVDQFAPLLLAAGAILGTGRVRERVVVIDKTPQVRPTVIITCCADHKVWDGLRASKFLREVKGILEESDQMGF
jgi:pyruvate/2-oxoglutarate dehydrogenase complex dihydrolipoamide acyltransferase (E2) component